MKLATLRAQLWWLVPALLALLLASIRDHRPLVEWRLSAGQFTECGSAGAWQDSPVPRMLPGQGCRLWRLPFELGPDHAPDQLLVLTGFGRDARIWINEQPLRDLDPGWGADYTSIPQRLPLPAAWLKTGANELRLELHSGDSDFDRSYLGRVLLGPASVLETPFVQSRRLSQQAAQVSIVFAIAIALMVLPIAWTRPRQHSYRWFALAVLSSQLFVWNMGWPLRPLPHLLWHTVAHAGLAVSLWALLRYTLSVSGASAAAESRINRVSALAMAALLMRLLDPRGDWVVASVAGDTIYRLVLLLQLLQLGWLWWRQRGPQNPVARWLAAGAGLTLLVGIADSLRAYGIYTGALTPYLQHWGIMYVLITLLVEQLRQVLAALAAAEDAQTHLGAALAERSAELQREFGLRQQAEQARTLAEERQRLMRDMHDGVGGHLVALMGQLEAGKASPESLKPQLRRTLDDLRLMIDSLDDACADLSVALGMLRQRLQPGLDGLDLTVRWNTAHLPDLAPCSPDVVLQVLRILQEAITNAVKHADCRHIDIDALWQDDELRIAVSDDGVGFDGAAGQGRGLPSMRQRAERIGAQLRWESSTDVGTRVELILNGIVPMRPTAGQDG